MTYTFNQLDHLNLSSLDVAKDLLKAQNCRIALIKKLPKNANDKNQVYIHADAGLLNSIFALRFSERGESTSTTKRISTPGKVIPQAVFKAFSWLKTDGRLVLAKECKAIIYAQYPEARLSGFMSVDNQIPRSMSIDYTKNKELLPRYLILGATPSGHAIAIMAVDPSPKFISEFSDLDSYFSSSVCKVITIEYGEDSGTVKLEKILREKVSGQRLIGCRFNKKGETVPFTSTQVHGYTLEHACGIKPNSDKNGDIFGIELKCFTRKKLTLFTPEPDGGLYSENFADFMTIYGYKKDDDYRFTGLHRAYTENIKTKLTLKIYCYHKHTNIVTKKTSLVRDYYNPEIAITKQMAGMEVVLEDRQGKVAASWSLERLLNCWGAKHNEVVYVPASKHINTDEQTKRLGYDWIIEFSDTVLWCTNTNAERLFKAIHSGIIYLDPAPKYNPDNPKVNKRRSQWRINDIYKATCALYEHSEEKKLT